MGNNCLPPVVLNSCPTGYEWIFSHRQLGGITCADLPQRYQPLQHNRNGRQSIPRIQAGYDQKGSQEQHPQQIDALIPGFDIL
jgi:hypothetical protein